METKSNERRVYESVDDRSLSYGIAISKIGGKQNASKKNTVDSSRQFR